MIWEVRKLGNFQQQGFPGKRCVDEKVRGMNIYIDSFVAMI